MTGTVLADGRTVVWSLTGSGPVTVVLEAGLTGAASSWCLVQPRLSSQVLAVSRAGYGGSSPVRRRSAHDSVDDLCCVLDALGITGPLVLVGHSWGGLLMRLLAARRPTQVVGLLLVDATHERFAPMRARRATPLGVLGMTLLSLGARTGFLRRQLLSGKGELGAVAARLSPAEQAVALAELNAPATWQQARRDIPAVASLLRELTHQPLPAPPCSVIAIVGGPATGSAAKGREMMRAAYEEWTATLSNARLVVSPQSGHLVPLEDPGLVVECIEELVARA
ncbi:MAG: hypothetical protein JWM40_2627 [Frankiales bacterium]|nr:hypothetical protein [Frankiales bacterium]